MNQEIINYIKQAQKHGLSEIEIKKNLLDAGWEAQILEDSFAHLRAAQNQPSFNIDEDIKLSAQTSPAKPLANAIAAPAQRAQDQQPVDLQGFAKPPWYKTPAALLVPLIILVLAGGAFAFYKYVYANPDRVWKKYIDLTNEKTLSSDFKFSYQDQSENATDSLDSIPLKDIKLEFSGKAYADTTDPQNPQSESEVTYSFSSGNTSFSTGFEYKLIGKKFFMNIGSNPFLESAFASLGKGKKIEWVSLDLDQLQKKMLEDSPQEAQKFNEIFNSQFGDELQKIWQDARLVKMDKYLGMEKINGRTTLHFKNSLDKDAVNAVFSAMLDKLINAFKQTGVDIKDDDITTAKSVINAIINKLEIKEFETWIGAKDFRLYKTRFKTNAPSVVSAVETLINSPRESSRDANRLADIKQMATALELYFNDNNRYPDSKDGQPLKLSPNYFSIIPTAQTPADGNCTDYFNAYWYEVKNKGASYEMTFCLGKATGGYQPGILKLSPAGIANVNSCPSTPANCYKSGSPDVQPEPEQTVDKSREEQIRGIVDKIDFSAEINMEANYSDYGVKKEVKPPENAFDLMELMGSSTPRTLQPSI